MTSIAQYYDSVPYVARCIETTNIGYLHALAQIFGLAPHTLTGARILELGCAGGMNLAPQAECHPHSQFLGIDISPGQIEVAQKLAAESGLSNIHFQVGDITQLGAELGTFDLILCHGVLSWVGPDVQRHVFRLCGTVLAPNGMALISYNTFPGWHQVQAVRDVLMFHCRAMTDPTQKLAAASTLLEAMLETVQDSETAYRAAIQFELNLIESSDPGYVMHDHFEADNHPFYIKDVVGNAAANGLTYIADAQLPSMMTGALNEKAARILDTATSLVEQEQYLDFLRNRRFRSSLFCRSGTAHSLDIRAETLFGLHVAPHLDSVKGSTPPAWTTPSAGTLVALNPVMEALCRTMFENRGRPVAMTALVDKAVAKSGETARVAVQKLLADLAPKLVWSGALLPYAAPFIDQPDSTKHPKAFAVARTAARSSDVVPNARHQNVTLSDAERAVIARCDGSQGISAIARSLGGKAKTDDVQLCVQSLAAKGLIVSSE